LALLVAKEISIAGLTLREGDAIEIGLGRQRIECIFRGFDRVLYCFYVETESNEMVIPYKSIKYIRKMKKS